MQMQELIDPTSINLKTLSCCYQKILIKSAKKISESISQHFQKNISVIITDTMGRPFRNGIVGFTIGSHNIECLLDERGKKRPL